MIHKLQFFMISDTSRYVVNKLMFTAVNADEPDSLPLTFPRIIAERNVTLFGTSWPNRVSHQRVTTALIKNRRELVEIS